MLSFITVCILMFVTPGPAVLSLAGTGAAYGWTKGLNYVAGLWLGHTIVSLAVISRVATIILADPIIRGILFIACASYFGYLGLRIAFAGSKVAFIHMSAPTLSTGVILQILNPKAYAAHTTFFSGFVLYPDNFLAEVLVKLVVMNLLWFSFHFTWLLAGVKLNELNLSAHRQKQINIGMASCLIFVVLISLHSLLNQ